MSHPRCSAHAPARYTLPEDVPEPHVTLSSKFMPAFDPDGETAIVHDFYFDTEIDRCVWFAFESKWQQGN